MPSGVRSQPPRQPPGSGTYWLSGTKLRITAPCRFITMTRPMRNWAGSAPTRSLRTATMVLPSLLCDGLQYGMSAVPSVVRARAFSPYGPDSHTLLFLTKTMLPVVAGSVGVTAFDGAEAGPVPPSAWAYTAKVYVVPLIRAGTVADVADLATCTDWPPGWPFTSGRTRYPVSAVFPFEAGGVHVTVADRL